MSIQFQKPDYIIVFVSFRAVSPLAFQTGG